MSDLNEGPGELPPELRDFFDAHRDTGEPTGAQLGKALLRVHTETRPVAPMTLRRRWLPPELMAVAAVLVVSVAGAAIGWYTKTQSAAANDEAAMAEARKAWAGGNLDSALVALERCTNADCVRLAAAVKRIQTRLRSGEALPLAAEDGSLLAIERELLGADHLVPKQPATEEEQTDREFASTQANALLEQGFAPDVVTRAVALFIAGLETSRSAPELATRNFREVIALVPGTALARRAEKRTQPLVGPPGAEPVVEMKPSLMDEASSSKPSVLLEQAKVAKKEKQYSRAFTLLERCLSLSPKDVECTLTLATVYASKGVEENSAADSTRARALYRQFLGIASPDDQRVPRVKAILAEIDDVQPERDIAELYLRAYQLRESEPDEARRLFEEVVRRSPDSIEGQKARNRLADLGARRGVGRLKIASSPTRARIYIDGVDTGRETPVLPGSPIEVSPGKHTVFGELDGRRSATTQLNVVEGENPVIKLLIQ